MLSSIKLRTSFNAAHKLSNPSWSQEKNVEVFGPCANENWHGHNFELIIKIKGEADPETGFVIHPQKLNKLIRAEILDKVDHKNLNLDVSFMMEKMASCENLVIAFWDILYHKIKEIETNARLSQLRLYETPRNFVDYYGPE